MDINQIKENKLKFILQFSIPSIISMFLQTAITITDAFFTGNYVGENALAAINLGLPILYFFLGIGLCVGVGGSVISGRLLGKQTLPSMGELALFLINLKNRQLFQKMISLALDIGYEFRLYG